MLLLSSFSIKNGYLKDCKQTARVYCQNVRLGNSNIPLVNKHSPFPLTRACEDYTLEILVIVSQGKVFRPYSVLYKASWYIPH